MRVTTLRMGEVLQVGDVLVVPIERQGNHVRLGIEAPPGVSIVPGELADKQKARGTRSPNEW